ncbi:MULTISPECIES: efflux RND transporter periplasmic adaptor subunit [Pandoraea]|uniref:efflux RND transporter periplasmic adaptor subunit n=1 Tax=Pandoraea TaxID=93217 RepID=UPI001F5C63C5|nr:MULTISPECIES: efflux RND transporter periplasmic adaptor subunit [Pandoraea]MCI3207325.1 efflux RND transporter periplasmic adaptor subunit [Pandoraea sp. LA3]MDN4585354.1 efflux RND transporter periplasmic adaptor subunit [Pandoraea capi]
MSDENARRPVPGDAAAHGQESAARPLGHTAPGSGTGRRRWVVGLLAIVVIAGAVVWLRSRGAQAPVKTAAAPSVTAATVEVRDVPVRLIANGTVTARQTIDVRPQISSTIRQVHIKEGDFVKAGQLLFSLDARMDEANLKKVQAQLAKDEADLANARRTLARTRQLIAEHFVSQSALDTAQSGVDSLTAQVAADRAAIAASQVAVDYNQIRAGIDGRTGAINVHPGSLVTPGGAALVSITQLDPIDISFTLPEGALAELQAARAGGPVAVTATLGTTGVNVTGQLSFIDNAVDSQTGTIRLKAAYDNRDAKLWPGMYLNVAVIGRVLKQASVVPPQAVQTGPDGKFVYVIGNDGKVSAKPVKVGYVEAKLAVVEGVAAGAKVVQEGAENLRPGNTVTVVASRESGATVASAGDKGDSGKAP